MAANEIKLKIRITEEGDLELIGKKAKAAAAATEKAGQASDNYSKKQKGVAGATANSTKAFSKMTTGIQGGLVPAYAEIAARVFALTAAFNVLARNNAILKLEEGLNFTGRAAGRNLPLVAQGLQDITGAAVSAEAAMRSVAVGTSAGFSQEQMEGLAQVARGAATALGRDLTDALDRLTRGAAKLEPEILDELGIMVRLDEVQRNFALSVNKSESELTQYEKRMAFTNAIIEQGIKKFGDLSKAVEPSAYDQLAASLSNISKTLVGGFSEALAPMANYLANNTAALTGLILAYAGLVGGSILGGIASLSAASAMGAQRTEYQANAALKAVKPNKLLGKAFNEVAASGDRSTAALLRMQKSLNMTINMTSKDMVKLKAAKIARNQLTAELYKQNVAQIKVNFTNAIGDIQTLGLTAATKNHVLALKELQAATVAAMGAQTGLAAAGTAVSGVLTGVAATARFAGAAIITALPYIAIFGTLAAMAYPYIKGLFEEPKNALSPVLEENTKRFEEFDNVVKQYIDSIENAETETEAWIRTLRPLSGLFTETTTAVNKTLGALQSGKILAAAENTAKLAKAQKLLDGGLAAGAEEDYFLKGTAFGGLTGLIVSLKRLGDAKDDIENGDAALQSLIDTLGQQAQAEVGRALGELGGALGPMASQLKAMGEEGRFVSDALKVVTDSQKEVNELMTEFASGGMSAEQVAERLQEISIKTNSAVAAFDNFSDVLAGIQQQVGNVKATLGPFAGTIDNLTEGVNQINQMAKDTAGRAAGRQKALDILALFGIGPEDLKAGESAIDRVNTLSQRIVALNDRILAQEEAKKKNLQQEGMTASGPLKTRLGMLLEEVAIQREAMSVTVGDKRREHYLQLLDAVNAYNNELAKMSKLENERMGRLGGEGMGQNMAFANSMGDLFNRQDEEGNTIDPTNLQIMETANTALQPMLESLSKLGPEGEVYSAAFSGLMNITEAVVAFGEEGLSGTAKLQAGLAVAGAAVQAFGQMQQAQANAAVAGIDRQIAAEKKRDGKSAQSQEKIAALEKKKDRIKRKAFEQNKKAQMASTVINTATGIMAVMDDVPAPFNFILAGLVGALGASQLATIASSSYEGGASSTPSVSKVAVGKRSNTVDLARARSPAGELAYARGASGTGQGMTNYKPTPAFTGAKYRAAGGAAFMIGEQGPEMFVPETPGTIVPADEVDDTRGISAPTNINFTINAVDAPSVQEMLLGQRGNIIGMIREAANASGEPFIESVNVLSDSEEFGPAMRN